MPDVVYTLDKSCEIITRKIHSILVESNRSPNISIRGQAEYFIGDSIILFAEITNLPSQSSSGYWINSRGQFISIENPLIILAFEN